MSFHADFLPEPMRTYPLACGICGARYTTARFTTDWLGRMRYECPDCGAHPQAQDRVKPPTPDELAGISSDAVVLPERGTRTEIRRGLVSVPKRTRQSRLPALGTWYRVVYDAVLAVPGGTVHDIAEVAGVTCTTARRRLQGLYLRGLVNREGAEFRNPKALARYFPVEGIA